MEFKKKIILITGSSKGIGLEIAKKFLKDSDYFVILNSRKKNSNIIQIQKNFSNTKFIEGNINSANTIKKILNFLNAKKIYLNSLICNVGSGKSSKVGKEKIYDYKQSMSLNFYSSLNPIYGLKEKFIKKGKIVCISSIASRSIVDTPIAYSVSKASLNSFIVNFAKNYKINNICITGILPGHTLHKTSVWKKNILKKPKLTKSLIDKHIPTGEWIIPEDISSLTYFLVNHNSNAFNGSLIDLEGGITTK